MKKLCLVCLVMCCAIITDAQTLFTYGKQSVSVDEFLRAYNKNKAPDTDREKSIREYLDLYIRFKLKVQAARELRMDTLTHIKSDINGFRRQVEENYMNDQAAVDALLNEATERGKRDLHIIHYSIAVDSSAAADTLKVFRQINDAAAALSKGKDLKGDSQFASVRNSDIGFVTVFSLPYPIENIVYGLKPGQVSKPYRTKSAWHIFKVAGSRPNIGKLKVAQILFAMPPAATETDMRKLQLKADSVYGLLKAGADFAETAKKYSEDRLTYLTGGELPEFGSGQFDPVFEKHAVALADGVIGKPFTTPFGIHILKRISHAPANFSDASYAHEIREKLKRDSRVDAARHTFLLSISKITGFKKTNLVKESDLLRFADTVMVYPQMNAASTPISKKIIIKFDKGTRTGADWLNFVKEYKGNYEAYKGESNKELLDKYMDFAIAEYYRQNLEDFNPDFAYHMKEFGEGNILFEIMEKKVWGYASTDSAGLHRMYLKNRANYKWPASASMIIINAVNDQTAGETVALLKNGRNWREINEAMAGAIQADSGRYELSQIVTTSPPVKKTVLPVSKNSDGSSNIIMILDIFPAGEYKTFEEARGLIINDYQGLLEEEWLAELRKLYPVKVNDSAFNRLL